MDKHIGKTNYEQSDWTYQNMSKAFSSPLGIGSNTQKALDYLFINSMKYLSVKDPNRYIL